MPPTLTTITTLLYLFGIPLIVVLLAKRWPIINKISPMVILYVIGLVVGNCGWIGEQATHVCTNVSNVVVLLTIPLMLLGCNYKGLSAGMAVKAFFIGKRPGRRRSNLRDSCVSTAGRRPPANEYPVINRLCRLEVSP